MRAKPSGLLTAIPVIAGAVAGYLLHSGSPQPRWLRHIPPHGYSIAFPVPDFDLRRNTGAIEKNSAGHGDEIAQENDPQSAPASDPFDPKERLRLFQERLAAHDSEAVDRQWAQQTETRLSDHLTKTSRQKWKILRVDCRTTTCTATLEWSNYRDALLTYNHVLSGRSDSDPNCTRTVLLPEPVDANTPYETRAIFDCTETR